VAEGGDHREIVIGVDPVELANALLQVSETAIHVVDLQGSVLLWSQSASELYGWTEQEALGSTSPVLVLGADDVTTVLRRIAASGSETSRQAVISTSDGRAVPVTGRLQPLPDADGHIGAVLVSDARELDSLRAQATGLHVAEQIRRSFAAAMGYAQLLLNPDISADAAKRAKVASSMKRHINQTNTLLEDITWFAQGLDGGRTFDLRLEPVDVLGLVTDVVCQRERRAECGEGCFIDVAPNVGTRLMDRARMRRGLEHLLFLASPLGSRGPLRVSVAMKQGNVEFTAGDDSNPDGDSSIAKAPVAIAEAVAKAHGGYFAAFVSKRGVRSLVISVPLRAAEARAGK